MKKNQILLGAAGLLALGLTACSNELPVQEPQKATADEDRFIAVTLSMPNVAGTRAFENGTLTGDTQDGTFTATAGESYVYCLDFLFYDTNGDPTGEVTHIGHDDVKKQWDFKSNETGDNVERFCTSVVPVTLTQGQNLPAQVVCIVNGNDVAVKKLSQLSLNSEGDESFRQVAQPEFSRNGNFLMTNSVYYGQDEITGQANQRLCATPINANSQLHATRELAKQAAETNPNTALVNIYVERVAARVSLNLDNSKISDYEMDNGDAATETDPTKMSIRFVPEYWFMNAVDKETYLTKRYGVDVDGTPEMYPDFAAINGALTAAGFNNWNSVANHRSYWASSPSYFKSNFPLVSDQVFDPEAKPGVTYDPYNSEHNKYDVNYFSYNSVVAGINNDTYSDVRKQWKAVETKTNDENEVTFKGFDKSVIYTRETTTPKVIINNDITGNPAAAVGSAVILGHYEVVDNSGENETTETKTFYVDRNNGEKGTYYGSELSAKKALLARQTILFVDEDGKNAADFEDLSEANRALFVVEHPKASVRTLAGTPNVAGRLVTLQLSAVPQNVYFYDAASEDYIPVNSGNLDQVNAMLVSQTGYFDMFYNGLGFFSIPIRHLNFKTASYDKGVYNWKTMSVGELGIVRNHVYDLTVSSITGIANGLRSQDQPIVPAKDTYNQYVAVRLNILAWNIANQWTVEL